MPDFQGQTVAIADWGQPLVSALADAFAREGASIRRIADDADLSGQMVDALIVPSPASPSCPTLELSDMDWASAIERGLSRAFRLVKAAGAGMIARRRGCILIVGALDGSTGWPAYAASSAVHGALLALTRSLAVEWAAYNVRVMYLACGAVEGASPAEFAARTPLGRAAAPDEIARVALYLAGASFTTGTEFRADGGWSAWGLLT